MTGKSAVKPITVKVFVRTRGGNGIDHALVKMTSGALPDPISAYSDKNGVATLALPASIFPESATEVDVRIVSSKAHHGPVPAGGGTFSNGPVAASAKILKQGAFAKDTANVDKLKRLEMVLVDGGSLGALHAGTLTRRLSTQEVVEELVYHHACGNIRLIGASEFKCQHDVSSEDPDGEKGNPCTEKCSIVVPVQTAANRISMDGMLNGVDIYYLAKFIGENGKTPSIQCGKKPRLSLLYRRHAVGMIRLCGKLFAAGYRVLYSVGLEGSDPLVRDDCHGQGRAMDISGVATEVPENVQAIRLGVDFIVFYHWGKMNLRVETTMTDGSTETKSVAETGKSYDTDTVTTGNGALLFRLDPIPEATARPKNMPMTDEHLTKTAEVFKTIFDFVSMEYSFGDNHLGSGSVTSADALPAPEIGSSAHFMLYPDYPTANHGGSIKNGRQAHVNHFHVQLGVTGTQDWKTL